MGTHSPGSVIVSIHRVTGYRFPLLQVARARMASVCVAYILWLLGGWFGLHHFYLGRDRQAFVWWCLPGGYFGLGWIRDLWRIPEYVRETNRTEDWVSRQQEKMKESEQPPWKMARWGGMLVVGNLLGMLPSMAVPNKDDLGGVDLWVVGSLLTPLGCALGIWLVGNIGRWEGDFKRPLIGCYLTLPAYLYGMSVVSWTTIIGAYMFKRQWKKGPSKSQKPLYVRILVLGLCGSLYLSMWGSYLYFNAEIVNNGDKIKSRDALGNFMKSPAVQEFGRTLKLLWEQMLANGFWSTWSQLVDSLDPFGERNALKELGLAKGASQEEIRSKYRELAKVYHPDMVKGSLQEKEEAQQKFVAIQTAYEKLSTLKKQRAKANKRMDREERDQEHKTETKDGEKVEL